MLSESPLTLLAVASLAQVVDAPMSTERLRQAVAGLGGLAGALLLPMLSSWLRLLMQLLEPNHSGLGHQQRVSGLAVARALLLTLLLGFIVMNWQQATSELQQVQAEAPIVGSTLTGFAIGLVLWLIYALGLGALRADWQRARTGRRIGGLLR
ncbi:MAG: hypothetical protein IPO88_06980 [Nannocystis sp.]|uniref:hypothetical protein n=1 Tax=Nannocystis sp. TaxID=1962667 RepID=UPI002428A5FF|nr:hypothetical protein [Nannocystis sp.]MBK9753241.1 hypothetical protein [Nannocystis sp.]